MSNTTVSERMDQLDGERRWLAVTANRAHLLRLAGRRFDWYPPTPTPQRRNPFDGPDRRRSMHGGATP